MRLRFFIPLVLAVALFMGSVITLLPMLLDPKEAGIVQMDQAVHHPLFERFEEPALLLFFGYVGCSDVCTPRLNDMARAYRALGRPQSLRVLFVDVAGVADGAQARAFAAYFDDAFEGLVLEPAARRALMREFEIYLAPSLTSRGNFDHTAFFYLLRRDAQGYHLVRIFTQSVLDATALGSALGQVL